MFLLFLNRIVVCEKISLHEYSSCKRWKNCKSFEIIIHEVGFVYGIRYFFLLQSYRFWDYVAWNTHMHSLSAKGLRSSFLVYTYKGESIIPCCIIATGKVKRVFNWVVETSTFDLARVVVQVDRSFSIKNTNVFFPIPLSYQKNDTISRKCISILKMYKH